MPAEPKRRVGHNLLLVNKEAVLTNPFKTHPASMARRIELRNDRKALRAFAEAADDVEDDDGPDWLEITLESPDEDVDAALQAEVERRRPVLSPCAPPLPPPGAIASCPLGRSWRLWDMSGTPRYWDVPAEAQPVLDAAAAARPSDYLGLVRLGWELARDDAAFEPMTSAESGQPDWKYSEGSPRHLHAETVIGGARVHVDWVYASKHGPGRSITEVRIFADGRLVGRGGRCGCSLGFGKEDLPAVALLSGGKALTVDDVTAGALHPKAMPELVAEFWDARDGLPASRSLSRRAGRSAAAAWPRDLVCHSRTRDLTQREEGRGMAAPFPDEVRQFVETTAWRFAKTYAATWPHEYVVRTPENAAMILALAQHVFVHGVDGRFYSQVRKYHHEGGKVYWSMDATPEGTQLVNRCDEAQTWEARLAAGTLPKR